MEINKIINQDCLEGLKGLPYNSVNCCVTSPPYFGLRDYGVEGQLGLEESPELYIEKMVEVFREVKRVLRKDGTLWLNIGDTYNGNKKGNTETLIYKNAVTDSFKKRIWSGAKQKDLIGIPWMLAFALRQPYYAGKIKDERDRVWMAAMIDAEGSICGHEYENNGKQKTNLYISITNSSRPIIDKCDFIFPQSVKHVYQKGDKRNVDVFRWDVEQMAVKQLFIQEIYPYLVAKRKQAIIGYTFLQFQKELLSKKKGYLPAQQEKRSWLIQALSKLNHGENIDLPDWVQEPISLHGPGFYLRQDIIWSKPNQMPESVTDRCTKSHEYIFLLSKSKKYYYDADAIKTTQLESSIEIMQRPWNGNEQRNYPDGNQNHLRKYFKKHTNKKYTKNNGQFPTDGMPHSGLVEFYENGLANKRSVWTVNTVPYSEAHFATFPEQLIVDCIKAGCPENGIILDPFMGAGTTALVSRKLNRNFIGFELNPEYIKIAEARLKKELGMFI